MSKQPLQTAMVITELAVGGAERCLVNLATGLDPNRFAVQVYSLGPCPAGQQRGLVDRLESAGIPVHFVDARSGRHLPMAIRRLRQMLAAQSPRIVQTFLFHANVIGSLAVGRNPRAQLLHGIRVADPSRWRGGVERFAQRRADKVVCVSDEVAEAYRGSKAAAEGKLIVIPNGIELERYPVQHPADLDTLGLEPGRRALAFVGRLHEQKGVDWLLASLPDLLDRIPDVDLLIVGDGPQKTDLMAQASSLGIERRVRFLGWRPDVPEILAACAMLILPSRWEGMPNVLLEAMASGLPVLSTRVAGVTQLLGSLAEAQTVLPGDSPALHAQLSRLLGDAQLARQLGAGNRQRVAQHFSLPAMIGRYADLYEDLACRGAAKG